MTLKKDKYKLSKLNNKEKNIEEKKGEREARKCGKISRNFR